MDGETTHDAETLFFESIKEASELALTFHEVDLVIGISFNNEMDNLMEVLKGVEEGVTNLQSLQKSLILCVGDWNGFTKLDNINNVM